MTYYKSESAVAGANQQKLIIEVWTTPDVGAIAWNTNSVSIRVKASTHQNLFSGDNQTFNRTGNWAGSTTYYMPGTANATVVIADQTYNVTPQQGSTTTVNYGGNITGHYEGASFSANVQVVIAAKPYPASKPTLSASNFDMGTTVTINTNRINTGFTHTVKYKFNAATGTIATGVGASTTWSFPIATLAPQIPTTAQGSGTITLDTYNGSTLVGTESVTFTAKVPSSVVPTIGTVNASEANTAVASAVGAYVKTLTDLRVQLTGCSAPHGASITKHEVVVQNYSYDLTNLSNGGVSSNNTVLSRKIDAAGTIAVVGKVTDSRGRAYQKTLNITVLDYALPNPTELTVQRCDSAGTVDPLGTYAKVTSKGTISSLIVGSTEKNQLQYKLEYRLTNADTWTVLKNTTTVAGLSLNSTETLGSGQFAPTSAYEFRLRVYDKFNIVGITTRIGTSEVTLSLNKTGVGIGKVWQKGSIDAKGSIFTEGTVNHNGLYNLGLDIVSTTSDLNTYVVPGFYIQKLNALAASGANYPEPTAGLLEVQYDGAANGWVYQRYTTYANLNIYVRNRNSGTWSAWKLVSATVDSWTSAPYINGWTNFSDASWHMAQYRRVGDTVELRGMMSHTATAQTGMAFVLPVGFRPSKILTFPVMASGGLARVDLDDKGQFFVRAYYAGGTSAWVNLSTVRFAVN